ncbi:MAG: hypothetical protein AB7U83_19680 [Vicinamibacterales bacterium]
MSGTPAARRVTRALAGAWVGASAWLSAGTLAVTGSSLSRIGALPDIWWLGGAVAGGGAAGLLAARRIGGLGPLAGLAVLWLPWLPFHVPAAFLLWEGPLEGVVWAGVVAALVSAHGSVGPARMVARLAAPDRAPWVAAALAAAVFATAWAVARPRVPAGDEPHYLVIAQSLLHDGDLRIENNHQAEQYLAYYDGLLRPDFMQRGIDGEIYSIHAPGVAAVVLPAFAAAGYPGAVATVVVLVAAGTAAAWLGAYWLTASAAAAWAGWLALVMAAPFTLHGFAVYPDGVGAAAAAAGLLALVALDSGRAAGWTARHWAGVGAVLALLPWLHTRFALVAAVLGGAIGLRLVVRRGGGRAVAALLVVPAVAAIGWFAFFWRIYGTPNPAAPYGARPEGALGFIPAGLVGLLVDQQFGLVANAPILAAGLVGLWPLVRRRPRLALELLALVVPYGCAVATYPMWWGGYSAPGRFAVVVLPAAVLPIAAWWSAGPTGRWTTGVLIAVSAAITALVVGRDRGSLIYNGRDGHALLLDWLSPSVDLTLGVPSVHRDGVLAAAGDAAVWGLAAVAVGGAIVWLARRRGTGPGPTAAVLAAPLTVMAALSVVWPARDRPWVTPPTSQMAFLDRWHPAARPWAVAVTPTRRLALADLPPRLSLATSLRGYRAPGVSPLLRVPFVPAGTFDVVVEGATRLDGVLTVQIGRDAPPSETWPLAGRTAGLTGLVVDLPAIAHSVTVIGDDTARAAIRRLTLRPRRLIADETAVPLALRAARYGPSVVFALDDNAYLEPGAMWIRGERAARVMVRPDAAGLATVRLHGGPVANTVTLAAAGWQAIVPLDAEAQREVTLPAAALAPAVLTVTSASGFRPAEHAAGNQDVRWLGVYLTWP